jgi:putative SOS response-associated peptidase YedK
MCGRFSLSQPVETLAERFRLDEVPTLEPDYNVAPTDQVATVLVDKENQNRQFRLLHWGLIPSWAKDPKIGVRMINARAETVAEKPAFRSAFRHRRCLVLADGFYEWQQVKGKKQPIYIRMQNEQPFAFAGLWEHWQGPDDSIIDSCTLLTTESNELLRPIHNRMPVILKPKDYDLWLAPEVQDPESLQPLLCPYLSEEMTAYPVSTQVNNPVNNAPELTRAV